MATSQLLRNSHLKTRAPVKKSFSEDVFQSVKSLLQSEKELCSVASEGHLKQHDHADLTEVTFLGFNEETDAAHIQDLAAVSSELPDLLNSLHFCSLNENEIICMKDINKSSEMNNDSLNQTHHSGMLCVMRVSPTLPRLRIDFIFSLLSKYATGIRYTLDTCLHQKHQRETTDEDDDDDTNQSVSSIEDDFVTAFEHLEEEETSKLYNDGIDIIALKSQCDAASQTISCHHIENHHLRILVSSGQQKSLAKPSASLVSALEHKELPSMKTSVTTPISEPWIQRSFYRASNASEKGSDGQKTFFSSSPAYSSESECSSPSPVIFLDEEGYQKSLKAKLELPKIPVMKDDIEDSDSEVSEFFDSFDQFDELEQASETSCLFIKDTAMEKSLQKKGHKHEKSCMNPQKFKFDRPALPANVRKPTPRKPESPYSNLCEAPDSPRPVKASGEESGLFSPVRTSAFSPPGGCTPAECFCQSDNGGDRIHESHDSIYYTYEDYADSVSYEVLDSVLHAHHGYGISDITKKEETKTVAQKHGHLDQHNQSKTESFMIKDSIQKFAADLVEKSLAGAFKDLQKGVSSCTSALCHLAVKLTSSVFQMAFNELRRQRAFSLKERAISGLANFLVSEALSNALKDLQYVKKQMFTNTVARFAADLAEELVFEGIMEVCQFSYPPTPASPQCKSFDFENKVVKSYAKDLSESVLQEAFIELSQVDMTFTTKAAVSVSVESVKGVSAESLPLTQTFTFSPFTNQVISGTKPTQDSKKEYTVQQALFCTSGIVTSIPVPLAGSALRPYRTSSAVYQGTTAQSSDGHHSHDDSPQTPVPMIRKGEVACLRNVCLPSEHNSPNQSDFKTASDDVEMQSSPKSASEPVIISNFSAAMARTLVNETLESVASFEAAEIVNEYTSDSNKVITEKSSPLSHCDPATLQQREVSNKDIFADCLSKSVIKHSIGESKSVTSTRDKNAACKEGIPIPGEESQLTFQKGPKFLDTQDHLTDCSLSVKKDCVPVQKNPIAHGFSLETLPTCPTLASQKLDLTELAKDKPVKKQNVKNTAIESWSFGQESPFPHSHAFSSSVYTCVDGFQVEDKPKIRDRNVIPDTPPSTPLLPSQASSEWDIKKLTKKLKGELAKEFAPATPPSTPHNSSVGNLSENEQNTIEKEEFMLKLMRSLSEEVEGSEDEEQPQVDVKLEHSRKKVQFAEGLATHIISTATEMAASHLDNKITQELEVKRACLGLQSQRSISPTLNRSAEGLQTLYSFAGDMATEVITEAEKIAKAKSYMIFRQRKNSCYLDGDRDYRSEEKLNAETVTHPKEVDSFLLSLPPSSCMSGLTYKYPSCESVTDEYAGHIIQILKKEGGNSELIMDQYANRLAYRSVKSGLQEAAKTAKMKCSTAMFPWQSSQVKTNSELQMLSNKDHHTEIEKRRQSKRNGGYLCKNQTCERVQDTYRSECSELYSFSSSLAHSIARDVKKELAGSTVSLPKSLTKPCLYNGSTCSEGTEHHIEPESPQIPKPSQHHGLCQRTGSTTGHGYGMNVVQAIEQYAKKVVDDTLELSLGSALFPASETTKSADRVTYAQKLSPLISQACRYCDLKELHDCTGSSSQQFPRQSSFSRRKPVSTSKFSNVCQKSKIFHLDVPQIHVNLDKKTLLAEKIVAEAIEKAEKELSNTSVAADSGIGQDGVSFAESLTTEIMTSALTNIGQAVSCSKEVEDFQSTESFSSQQMNLSIGEDSTGSWSNLSFEDEHQDESSSFHHLSESSNGNSSSWSSLGLEGDLYEDNLSFPTSDRSDGSDDKDEEPEDDVEGLEQEGKTLLITNIDMEPSTVDPQLRIILQWLVASEAEVAELYFHDSAKKEFILLSRQLQEKGWKVGDLLQAVLKYYEGMENTASEERSKSLFDWLMENA